MRFGLRRGLERELAGSLLRSNPAYEFIDAARLGLPPDSCVLSPLPGNDLPKQLVTPAVAVLFTECKEATSVFALGARRSAECTTKDLVKLCLDSIIQFKFSGEFVSGPSALPLLLEQEETPLSGVLGGLSLAALNLGATFPSLDAVVLARKLYLYNTMPPNHKWQAAIRAVDDVRHLLGLSLLNQLSGWNHEAPSGIDRPPWLVWNRNSSITPRQRNYKLYLSPLPEDLGNTFQVAAPILMQHDCLSFKVGATLHNIMRPDKFVAYFDSQAEMIRCARQLQSCLEDQPSQGVPFSAQISRTGLLSWAREPHGLSVSLGETQGESWRVWVVSHLAAALSKARRDGDLTPHQSIQFSLARLWLEGVDVEHWHTSVEDEGTDVQRA